ncbi:MAG: hypothetical protein MJZ04_01905 [Bacteroidales bacterium]|nr:hypothetical protein [Bacteroidales bacterium]
MLLTLVLFIFLQHPHNNDFTDSYARDTLVAHYVNNGLKDFPTTFTTFTELFGEQGIYYNSGDGCLMWKLYSHPAVNLVLLCRAVLRVSIDGVWMADQICGLQDILHVLSKKNKSLFIAHLGEHTDDEAYSIWRFYFSGLYPDNYQSDYERLMKDPDYAKYHSIVKKAYIYNLNHPVR